MEDSACVFGCIRNAFFNLVGNVQQKLPWFGTSRGRLGYRVRNDVLVPVPVHRSRTRMRDAVIDLAAIPMAAWRVWRRRPRPRPQGEVAV